MHGVRQREELEDLQTGGQKCGRSGIATFFKITRKIAHAFARACVVDYVLTSTIYDFSINCFH
jgi:hypothetical protein